MKKLRSIAMILFLSLILGGMTSCEVSRHTENGRHRGWFHHRERHDDHPKGVIIIDNDHR
jgi:hypothetical protein